MNYFVSGEALNGRLCRGVIHVVKKGDTLYKISRSYDVPIADIIWKNPGVRIYNLQEGDRLCIPVQTVMPEAPGMPGNPVTPDSGNATETFPYVAREGEDLDQILTMFNLTYDELKALNPDRSPFYEPGTILNIPSDRILRRESGR